MTLLIPAPESLHLLIKEFAEIIQAESGTFRGLTFNAVKAERQLRTMLTHPHWFVCIALTDEPLTPPEFAGIIIGSLEQKFFSLDTVGQEQLLYVLPSRRSEGHGRRLLQAFVEWATRGGARKIFLDANFGAADTLNAEAMYAKMGQKVGSTYAIDPRPAKPDSA